MSWDNAPAHRGEAVREYLGRPGLNLRLVNPVSSTGRLCRATVRTSTPMRPSGAGREGACPRENEGGHWQSAPGDPGDGTGTGEQLPVRSGQPEGRGETALPDGAAIKGRGALTSPPSPIPASRQMHIPPWLWSLSQKSELTAIIGTYGD